ncbi:hypothetical protein D9M70_353840 [compost metagenome]
MRRQGQRVDIQVRRLVTQADIATGVGKAATDDRVVDLQRLVAQVTLAIQLDAGDQLITSTGIAAPASDQRIGKGSQSDVSDEPRAAGADLAHQGHDRARRKAVGLDLIGTGQCLHLRGPAPVSADDPPHQPFVSQALQAASTPVADTQGMHQGQIAGVAGTQERLFDRSQQCVRFKQGSRSANGQSRAVTNSRGQFVRRHTASSHCSHLFNAPVARLPLPSAYLDACLGVRFK